MEANPKHHSLLTQMGCFLSEVIIRAYWQMSLKGKKKNQNTTTQPVVYVYFT